MYRNANILIADPQNEMRNHLCQFLTGKGFQIFQTSSPDETAETIKVQRPDVLIAEPSVLNFNSLREDEWQRILARGLTILFLGDIPKDFRCLPNVMAYAEKPVLATPLLFFLSSRLQKLRLAQAAPPPPPGDYPFSR